MLFYYVQIKDRHDPGVNIREKARVASIIEAEGSSGRGGKGGSRVCSQTLSKDLGEGKECPKKTFRP